LSVETPETHTHSIAFIPINNGPAASISSNTVQIGHARGIDRDSIYDILTEPLPKKETVTKKRKRKQPTPAQKREILETPIKQLRHGIIDGHAADILAMANISGIVNKRLSTPPDSSRGPAKRTKIMKSQPSEEFPNMSITKPNINQQSVNKPIITSSHGYTIINPSTIAKVSFPGQSLLAKTTLEKLAAFRYLRASDDKSEAITTSKALGCSPVNGTMPESGQMGSEGFIDTCQDTDQHIGTEFVQDGSQVFEYENQINYEDSYFLDRAFLEMGDLFHKPLGCMASHHVENDTVFGQTASYRDVHFLDSVGKGGMCMASTGSGADEYSASIVVREHKTIPQPAKSDIDEYDEGITDEELIGALSYDNFNAESGCHGPENDKAPPITTAYEHLSTDNGPYFSSLQAVPGDEYPMDDGLLAKSADIFIPELILSPTAISEDEFPVDEDLEASLANLSEQELICSSEAISNDQYPTDDDLEAEMANISENVALIIENHHPPESVLLHSDAESRYKEVYDDMLQFSPLKHIAEAAPSSAKYCGFTNCIDSDILDDYDDGSGFEAEDWAFIGFDQKVPSAARQNCPVEDPIASIIQSASMPSIVNNEQKAACVCHFDDGAEYLPLPVFARPAFPTKVRDRSPIAGICPAMILRTCFRIGEALREGAICSRSHQDAVIELFARVTFSSRQDGLDGSHKQHFQFADIFHDRPPFMNAVLENYLISTLQESETRVLLGKEIAVTMVRCMGRLKRVQKGRGWIFDIINIRATNWEEVRWTKRIAGAGMVKSGDESWKSLL
jgi:hypothetical protein